MQKVGWLVVAKHVNRQTAGFAEAVENHAEATMEYLVQANEVFLNWKRRVLTNSNRKVSRFSYGLAGTIKSVLFLDIRPVGDTGLLIQLIR